MSTFQVVSLMGEEFSSPILKNSVFVYMVLNGEEQAAWYERKDKMYVKEKKGWFKHVDFMLFDLLLIEFIFMLSYYIRHGTYFFYHAKIYQEMAVALVVFHIFIVFFMESYQGILKRGHMVELKSVVKYNTVLFAGLMSYMMFRKNTGEYSRLTLILFFLLDCMAMYVSHEIYKKYLRSRKVSIRKLQCMILVTDSSQADLLVERIRKNEIGSTRLIGIVLLDREATGQKIQGVPVVADRKTMYEYARVHVIDEVLIHADMAEVETVIDNFMYMGITVHIDLESILKVENGIINNVNTISVLTTSINTVTARQVFLKRCLDISVSLIGIFVTLFAMVIFGPVIYFQSPGPVFFTQERVGKNGRRFRIIKFRSMYMDAEERKKELLSQNEMQGFMFKMSDDPRIIPIGKFLRKTSMDELPQFFNILRGDMSLVGTRPPTVDEYEKYDLAHKSRLATKPGLTGMWQVSGRNDITDFNEVVKLDNEYIRNWNLGLDMKIIWKTIGVVLKGRGAE